MLTMQTKHFMKIRKQNSDYPKPLLLNGTDFIDNELIIRCQEPHNLPELMD